MYSIYEASLHSVTFQSERDKYRIQHWAGTRPTWCGNSKLPRLFFSILPLTFDLDNKSSFGTEKKKTQLTKLGSYFHS